jgi:ankyrin repeat protein
MDHGAEIAITPENNNGCYLLHFAIDDGLVDMARLLIERGKIPVDTLDQAGWSPLHLAAGHNFLDMVKILVQNGADINIKVSFSSFFI